MYMQQETINAMVKIHTRGYINAMERVIPELEDLLKTQWHAALERYIKNLKEEFAIEDEVENGRQD